MHNNKFTHTSSSKDELPNAMKFLEIKCQLKELDFGICILKMQSTCHLNYIFLLSMFDL